MVGNYKRFREQRDAEGYVDTAPEIFLSRDTVARNVKPVALFMILLFSVMTLRAGVPMLFVWWHKSARV